MIWNVPSDNGSALLTGDSEENFKEKIHFQNHLTCGLTSMTKLFRENVLILNLISPEQFLCTSQKNTFRKISKYVYKLAALVSALVSGSIWSNSIYLSVWQMCVRFCCDGCVSTSWHLAHLHFPQAGNFASFANFGQFGRLLEMEEIPVWRASPSKASEPSEKQIVSPLFFIWGNPWLYT